MLAYAESFAVGLVTKGGRMTRMLQDKRDADLGQVACIGGRSKQSVLDVANKSSAHKLLIINNIMFI